MIQNIFEQDLVQPQFSGSSWLGDGILSTDPQALRDRVNNLLPHEIIGEQSSLRIRDPHFRIDNPQLILFINQNFSHPQLYTLYNGKHSAQIGADVIQVLKELNEYGADSLERGMRIIEGSVGYATIPPFRKLELLLGKMLDGRESDQISLPASKKWPRGQSVADPRLRKKAA